MKPTEVNANNQNMDKNSSSQSQPSPNMQNPRPGGSRRFTPFPSDTFDDMEADIPDMFGDPKLREHIRSMRNPFDGWPMRKRSSSMNTPQEPAQTTSHHQPAHQYYQQQAPPPQQQQPEPDVYQHIYEDPQFMSHFGPHWDSVGRLGRKRSQQPGIFNNPEIFEHIPEFFDMFPSRRPPNMRPQETFRVPHEPEPAAHHHQVAAQQPATPPRPKYCDAAMQTDESIAAEAAPQKSTLNQHGLRNTVDLGQKSPSEQTRTERAQSAPPSDTPEDQQSQVNAMPQQSFASASASASSGPNGSHSSTGTSTHGPQSYAYANASAQPSHNQHTQSAGTQSSPYNQPQASQPTFQQPPSGAATGANNVRSVPIFVEGRNQFVNTPTPENTQAFTFNTAQTPHKSPQQKPTVQTNNIDSSANQPPQTPHTVDSINKIQAIQRDVLSLMHQVEKFAYTKQDKEYLYLDEMLTRNLLKLDTIDTNGKDSIRMARKEAIKCIQSSLTVLEAKAEINAKLKEEAAMASSSTGETKAPESTVEEPEKTKPEDIANEKHESQSAEASPDNTVEQKGSAEALKKDENVEKGVEIKENVKEPVISTEEPKVPEDSSKEISAQAVEVVAATAEVAEAAAEKPVPAVESVVPTTEAVPVAVDVAVPVAVVAPEANSAAPAPEASVEKS